VVLLFAVALLVLTVLLPLLRHPLAKRTRPRVAISDELVKDPVCQTYVVRSRAVRGGAADAPYFCSEECARRYVG